jgi:hypothetical protein
VIIEECKTKRTEIQRRVNNEFCENRILPSEKKLRLKTENKMQMVLAKVLIYLN